MRCRVPWSQKGSKGTEWRGSRPQTVGHMLFAKHSGCLEVRSLPALPLHVLVLQPPVEREAWQLLRKGEVGLEVSECFEFPGCCNDAVALGNGPRASFSLLWVLLTWGWDCGYFFLLTNTGAAAGGILAQGDSEVAAATLRL